MEIRSLHTIETAENVHIKVELAGLASRLFACLLDGLVMAVLSGLVMGFFTVWAFLQKNDEIAKTGVPLGLFAVFFGYHLFLEWLWNGRTLGKAILNIRVVRNNGQAIGFWESLGRNLLRLVDVYASGIGLLCMMFNRSEKRFGDFVAGTIVINDNKIRKPVYRPVNTVADTDEETGFEGLRITAEEAELLKGYQSRRAKLIRASRQQLADALSVYFSDRLQRPIVGEPALDELLSAYMQSLKAG